MTLAMPPALELIGIDKHFGSVHANRAVSLAVAAGSVHGLVGENGAGKSTLMHIVYGFHPADAGEIRVHGRPVVIRSASDALAAGIGMVHQHFMLVDTFTVLENVVLGAEGGWRLRGAMARARNELARLGRDFGLEAPLDVPVGRLPVGVQQRVEILKALYRGAEILILDEPTAVLTPAEADLLFRLLARLRAAGKTVILVTHKLREIMAATDRVAVMRQGALIADFATSATSPAELAETMLGRPAPRPARIAPVQAGAPVLEVRGLEVRDGRGVLRLKGASLAVRAGEIVGIAGVAGNGQSELLEALTGLTPPSAGTILIQGRPVATGHDGVSGGRRLGLGHVPEDRLRRGVVASFSAAENTLLGYQDRPDFNRGPLLDRAAIRTHCERQMAAWDVRPPQPQRRITAFSGGNQQKLVLAREIESGADLLVVGQPTRGVDIGAIEFIHGRLLALREAGKALLIVSGELEEILTLADRILVMAGGEIVGELARGEATEERIGLLMAGIGRSP